MNIEEIFIIIKAILWYKDEIFVPTDEEIMKFINYHKSKLERSDNDEKKD